MTQSLRERSASEELRAAPVSKARARFITPRAVILSVLLMAAVDYWQVQLEVVRYSFPTYAVPFYSVIFVLFVLTMINLLVRRNFPRLAFSASELMTVYVMLSISSAVCSTNMMQILMSGMGYTARFATPENGWNELFVKDLPRWLIVDDPTSIQNLYSGNSSVYRPENWRPWIVPIACWSFFCFVLLSTMLCINSILRKHWTESERLTFPIIHLPLEMVKDDGGFWKNPFLWAGFAAAGGITLMNGLNYLWPSFPMFPIKRENIGQYFVVPPWTALAGTQKSFYFFAIGLSYLMPLDLSFSCWFFFILYKLEMVITMAAGWNEAKIIGGGFDKTYPCVNSQAFGAYMAVFVMTMLSSRHYLKKVFRTAFTRHKELDESNEPVSYRMAILGVAAGFLFFCGFALKIGMSLWVVVIFFTVYFALAIMVTRIRAEFGFPIHDMHVMPPHNLIQTAFPTEVIGKNNFIGFSLFYWFNRTYASHPMPHQLEGFKFAERTNTPARQMFIAVLIASALAMPIGFWALLSNYFHYGAATAKMEVWSLGFGREMWISLESRLKQPVPTNWTSLSFVGVGFALASFMAWMRLRFLWFPFHPLAYAVADSWGMAQIWLPLMIGCIAKFSVLRFGGLSGYRRYLPFFLGLILGEIVIGGAWTLYGIIGGFRTYDFWP